MILKKQNGASAVEFAIILPLLLLLVFGIVEFGVMFFDKAMITNAAREGARNGILSQNPRVSRTDIEAVVNRCVRQTTTSTTADRLISFTSPQPDVTITTSNLTETSYNICRAGGLGFEDDLQVTVTYPYTYLFLPFGSTTLRGEAVMKCE